MRPRALLLALFLSCLAAPISAQPPAVSVLSTFARGSAVPAPCAAQLTRLASLLAALPVPQDWSIVIACDEPAWQRLLTRIDQNNRSASLYAVTSLPARITCLRGTALLDPHSSSLQPGAILAHEIAHLAARTRDEARAEQQAQAWLAAPH